MDKKSQIIKLLAEQIGVEPEDIDEEDAFLTDLHMNPTELSDFVHSLTSLDLDVSHLNLTEIETVVELLEALGAAESA
ncbi:MAG: hypothetical protein UX88_C0001G0047 [Candidatus Woesebacteria bacterium GW2011_GWC2_47_16]|uniref:Carrier domain-containing protein n=8 Tax=Candidatus Woeseibacteriota TaxID=1752722 RepID=A0A0G1QWT7_9BACT|nr:MAG: hypothetical protein UX03_C0003G0004 [Candidatus Woesebacteria bacterium GW2011_GWE1_45_18]KKU25140.1 MAG: hypothetical protein UX34_C0002G0003 [Candidatus Woesebacteria bacterium GW2011_GWF1_46_13]KKU49339.1 MAG: hypothetical protein UX67_C0002G0024 [Candidatus Woesebacteria bacterium GW2011_GWF2_46_8]KKU65387.1 MAG: hypothetical protein UX88_C0001G0047 [Candidatus Woesebacteria bacterium GW2011_GWC2_47_16]KKU71186.1 MAG: hypothetical protein UX95_C0002G0007 [Candidatus Woesebacteria b